MLLLITQKQFVNTQKLKTVCRLVNYFYIYLRTEQVWKFWFKFEVVLQKGMVKWCFKTIFKRFIPVHKIKSAFLTYFKNIAIVGCFHFGQNEKSWKHFEVSYQLSFLLKVRVCILKLAWKIKFLAVLSKNSDMFFEQNIF